MPLFRPFAGWCALLALACGSDPAPSTAQQSGSSGDVLAEVLEGCTAFAEKLCESARPCCEETAPFVADDCVTAFVEEVCTPAAQLVAAELATYDASAEDACLAAQQRAHEACVADWEQIVALRRDVWASCRVITGKIREGHHCDTDARCAPPERADATTACVQGVCQTIAILGLDEACPYPNGDVSTCDLGLYCTAQAQGEIGTCEAATPAGAACDGAEFLNARCGLGSYCDPVENVCRKATNLGGPPCTQDTECVSFVCNRASMTCREPLSTAASLCGTT
jgi:hypothetical protein